MQRVAVLSVLTVYLSLGISVGSCDDGSTNDETSSSPLVFAWIPKELENQVFETGRDGASTRALELSQQGDREVDIRYTGTATAGDVEGQASLVREAVAAEVDGMAISCNHPDGLKESINEAVAAGIPVMTFDSDSPDSDRFTYLGIDNEEGGSAAAKILGESMTGGTRTQVALVTGVAGAANLEARVTGFTGEMSASYPDLEIVETVYCEDSAETAATLIEELMTDYPELGGLFFVGLWPLFVCDATDCSESMPLWDAAAKAGEVKTVVFDTLDFQLAFVQAGMVQGLIGQKYWGWGFDAVEMLYDRVINDATFDDWTDSGIDVVCPNNVDEMEAMWSSVDFTSTLTPCEIDGQTI